MVSFALQIRHENKKENCDQLSTFRRRKDGEKSHVHHHHDVVKMDQVVVVGAAEGVVVNRDLKPVIHHPG